MNPEPRLKLAAVAGTNRATAIQQIYMLLAPMLASGPHLFPSRCGPIKFVVDGAIMTDNEGVNTESIKRRISGHSYSETLVEISFTNKDIIVKTMMCGSQVRPKRGGGIRGEVTCLSPASRRKLLLTARAIEGQVTVFASLTYGEQYPTDGRILQRHWSAMRTWLTRRGYKGLMVKEFQKRGAVHLHLLLDRHIDIPEAEQAWKRIISKDFPESTGGVYASKIRNKESVSTYVAKYSQKTVPAGFSNLGRFWSTFGGIEIVQERIVGTDVETAQLVAAIRAADERQRGMAWLPPNWKYGFTAWGVNMCKALLPVYLQYIDSHRKAG